MGMKKIFLYQWQMESFAVDKIKNNRASSLYIDFTFNGKRVREFINLVESKRALKKITIHKTVKGDSHYGQHTSS